MKDRFLKTLAVVLFFICVPLLVLSQSTMSQFLEQISALEKSGDFEKASQSISQLLAEKSSSLTPDEKQQLEWEKERLRRIRQDYSLTQEDLTKELQKRIKDFRTEEFDTWKAQGRFDSKIIDGKEYFVGPSVSNLFFRYPELREREIGRKERDELAISLWKYYLKLTQLARSAHDPLLYPRQVRVRMTITVDKDAVEPGKIVRCWMPYPRACSQQSGIQLLSCSPAPSWVDRPESLMRSLYFERKAAKNKPTVFSAQYTYSCYSFYWKVDPARVIPFDTNDCDYVYYTSERPPHVVFTPQLRQLSQEIVQDETNPYLKAKRIYDWMTHHVKYSYAREYSTLRNISNYVCDLRYGDCGQEALLFITLCRMNGIPARWQSGWVAFPSDTNMHDWSEIFIPPYGWLPVDVWAGIYFTDEARSITDEEKRTLADFYFGNLDHFRLIANNDHSVPLFPPKHSFRSDTVDFQRGELEADGKNIYYDKFSYKMEIIPVE